MENLWTSTPALLLVMLCLSWAVTIPVKARVLQEEQEAEEDPGQMSEQDMMDTYDQWPILCPKDNWYSKDQARCMPCSQCPLEQYITRPCYRFQDTGCAPLALHGFTGRLNDEGRLLPGHQGDSSPHRPGQGASIRWRPAALALAVVSAVLVTALLLASLAFCLVWRRQRFAVAAGEKLACSQTVVVEDEEEEEAGESLVASSCSAESVVAV